MRRHDGSERQDREDLEARLDVLQSSGSRKSRRSRRGLGPAMIAAILLVVGVVAIYLIFTGASGPRDEQAAGASTKVEVVKGDTLTSVASKLEEAGVVRNAFVFEAEARLEGYGTEIKTGRYTFYPGEESARILRKLTEGGTIPTISITVPEGMTLGETARTVAAGSRLPAAKVATAARETDYGYAFLENAAIETTEGYLFPSSYDFEKDVKAPQVVDRLLGQYLLETESLDIAGARDRFGLTEHELVTVASLIEEESANASERPVIASVIYNRLRKDMPLQIDATVQYALEKPKERLSLADLKVDSQYNTYETPGLPPGPICSPSRQSIEAAMYPEQTDYLYYVLRANDEEHFFTDDYDAFLREKAEARR
ncbi:MAG: endolytic transglycosylase MltG [Rubrobacter sp.]